jgi:hypothetical protein
MYAALSFVLPRRAAQHGQPRPCQKQHPPKTFSCGIMRDLSCVSEIFSCAAVLDRKYERTDQWTVTARRTLYKLVIIEHVAQSRRSHTPKAIICRCERTFGRVGPHPDPPKVSVFEMERKTEKQELVGVRVIPDDRTSRLGEQPHTHL